MGDLSFLDSETFSYISMIVIYSGLGPWLIGRLTRSRAEERAARREKVATTLVLLEAVSRARDASANDGGTASDLAAYDDMRARLSSEAVQAVAELNLDADEEAASPSWRFVVIPTPISAGGVLSTLLFAAALYFGVMVWLTLAWYFITDATFNVLVDPDDQRIAMILGGGGLALLAVAFGARLLAYWFYDRAYHRRSRKAAEAVEKAVGQANERLEAAASA